MDGHLELSLVLQPPEVCTNFVNIWQAYPEYYCSDEEKKEEEEVEYGFGGNRLILDHSKVRLILFFSFIMCRVLKNQSNFDHKAFILRDITWLTLRLRNFSSFHFTLKNLRTKLRI